MDHWISKLLLMEHDNKINSLEQVVTNLQTSLKPSQETLPSEVKQNLLKEVGNTIKDSPTKLWDGQKLIELNIQSYDIQEANGKVTLKIFTEGNYNWTDTRDSYGNQGIGRTFSRNFISNFDPIAKMYGVNDLSYEFYQNSVQIKSFITN